MVSIQLAQIVLVAGIATLTTAASFLVWWFYDQTRDWVVEVHPGEGVVSWGKKKAGKDRVGGEVNGERYEAKLEPEKHYYRKGWRSGRLIFIDVSKGVQVDPSSEVEKAVGYDLAKVLDAGLGESWRDGYVDENPFRWFIKNYGTTVLLAIGALVAVVVYMSSKGAA